MTDDLADGLGLDLMESSLRTSSPGRRESGTGEAEARECLCGDLLRKDKQRTGADQ